MHWQSLIVALLVASCSAYAVWTLMPSAARRVLAVQPDEPRAKALACLAGMANGESASDDKLASALQSSTNAPLPLLTAVALRALEHPAAFRRTVQVALDAAVVAPITRANADTLRMLALAAAKASLRERAQAFADRYAEACYALDQPAMPTLWPLRTAGAQVRACIVCAQGQLAELAAIVDAVAARATVALRWTVFAVPDGTMEATLSSTSAGLDVRPLPADVAVASRGMAAARSGLKPTVLMLARLLAATSWRYIAAWRPEAEM